MMNTAMNNDKLIKKKASTKRTRARMTTMKTTNRNKVTGEQDTKREKSYN